MFNKTILILSAFITTITVLMLLVALHTTIIIHQQEAFAQTIDNTFKRYENPTYGINIQYPSNWRIDEGDVYADDYVTDIVSFIAPIRSDTEAYGPSLSISIDNPPRNQLTDRYYEGYDWRGVCNNPFASNYISQPCDTLVTPDGNALTPNGKQVMEGLLCPQGRGIIGTLEMFVGSIPDHLESELATACGW